MTTRAAQALSRPVELGGLTVPNRIVMAPMTRGHSPNGVPGEDVAAYFARRAAGGTGLLITEASYVGHPSSGQVDVVSRLYGEEALAGWSAVVAAVHQEGGLIMPQLQHVGVVRTAGDPPHPDAPALSPSGLNLDGTPGPAHEMTPDDIDAVVQAFADAAATAEQLGFDGVELHGAHGYLIDQFLWSTTNRRTDAYGGDLDSRTRFPVEIIAAIRRRVSPAFPIVLRLSQWKQSDYNARIAETPDDLDTILGHLVDAGVDAFHASTRRFWQPAFNDSDLSFAGWTKKLSGKPTIAVGSVGLANEFMSSLAGEPTTTAGLDPLLDRLEADEFDMIAVGRALLADPDWAAKTVAGREHEITPFHAGSTGSPALARSTTRPR